jgi:hypothetical protein
MDKKITGVLMTIIGFVVSLVYIIYVLIAEETTYGGIGTLEQLL